MLLSRATGAGAIPAVGRGLNGVPGGPVQSERRSAVPVASSSSSVKRRPTREAVLDGLRTWAAAEAKRRPELEALGYFGSYARGDEGFGSDLDLIAVVAQSPLPFIERARDWKTETLPVPADLLVYTTEEWEALGDSGARLARVLAADTVWLVRKQARSARSKRRRICRSCSSACSRASGT